MYHSTKIDSIRTGNSRMFSEMEIYDNNVGEIVENVANTEYNRI